MRRYVEASHVVLGNDVAAPRRDAAGAPSIRVLTLGPVKALAAKTGRRGSLLGAVLNGLPRRAVACISGKSFCGMGKQQRGHAGKRHSHSVGVRQAIS